MSTANYLFDNGVTKKKCSRCKKFKSLDHFGERPGRVESRNGVARYRKASRHSACRNCHYQISLGWRKKNPEKAKEIDKNAKPARRRWRWLNYYGLTEQDYWDLLAKQGGKCAICGCTSAGRKTNLFHIDHCHKSGKVRGLLCNMCNLGIGWLGDDPVRLRIAAAYLEKNGESNGSNAQKA